MIRPFLSSWSWCFKAPGTQHLFRALSGCKASMQRSWTFVRQGLGNAWTLTAGRKLSHHRGHGKLFHNLWVQTMILEDFAAFYLGPTHPNVQTAVFWILNFIACMLLSIIVAWSVVLSTNDFCFKVPNHCYCCWSPL